MIYRARSECKGPQNSSQANPGIITDTIQDKYATAIRQYSVPRMCDVRCALYCWEMWTGGYPSKCRADACSGLFPSYGALGRQRSPNTPTGCSHRVLPQRGVAKWVLRHWNYFCGNWKWKACKHCVALRKSQSFLGIPCGCLTAVCLVSIQLVAGMSCVHWWY